ncbi:MAG: lipocalin family protein [Bacteroidales bacterium]|nr:lipocalin family protein [Bacteroidales bacterium]MDY6444754.1 lipocalin family protein [Bacteroidales bacterium]
MFQRILAVLSAGVLLFAGCRQSSFPTVEGSVIDATIHSVTVQTSEGGSFTVSTLGTDPMLVPGVLPGDEVRIAYETLPDGETFRAVRLDITTPSAYRLLPGIWRDCTGPTEVGLVLAEDGSARAVGLADLNLRDWSLDGDSLILTAADPTSPDGKVTLIYIIEQLDVDSLVLATTEGVVCMNLSRAE